MHFSKHKTIKCIANIYIIQHKQIRSIFETIMHTIFLGNTHLSSTPIEFALTREPDGHGSASQTVLSCFIYPAASIAPCKYDGRISRDGETFTIWQHTHTEWSLPAIGPRSPSVSSISLCLATQTESLLICNVSTTCVQKLSIYASVCIWVCLC